MKTKYKVVGAIVAFFTFILASATRDLIFSFSTSPSISPAFTAVPA